MGKFSLKDDIFKYAKETFNSEPEYLWANDPDSAVLRHIDNNKWYAIIMNIAKSKLGSSSNEKIDILDVKCDPMLIGSLLHNDGYFPAYHMNKQNWITITLDGSVPKEEIFNFMHLSFELTKKKRR